MDVLFTWDEIKHFKGRVVAVIGETESDPPPPAYMCQRERYDVLQTGVFYMYIMEFLLTGSTISNLGYNGRFIYWKIKGARGGGDDDDEHAPCAPPPLHRTQRKIIRSLLDEERERLRELFRAGEIDFYAPSTPLGVDYSRMYDAALCRS